MMEGKNSEFICRPRSLRRNGYGHVRNGRHGWLRWRRKPYRRSWCIWWGRKLFWKCWTIRFFWRGRQLHRPWKNEIPGYDSCYGIKRNTSKWDYLVFETKWSISWQDSKLHSRSRSWSRVIWGWTCSGRRIRSRVRIKFWRGNSRLWRLTLTWSLKKDQERNHENY